MTLVRVGERGVDFSFARPPADRLLELGFTFIVGYISVPPASPAKNISKAECEAYVEAGIKVLLVWEMSATRPNLGASYGTMDGTNAKRLALDLGYPTDIPILAADDTNTVATNIAAHEAYMRAFAISCAPYQIGIYGDTDILDACTGLWRIGWLPNAWAWSGGSRAQAEAKAKTLGAHVLQRKGYYIDNIWAVDPNDVINDFPAWGQGADPFPPPNPLPQPEDDMPTVITNLAAREFKGVVYQPGAIKWALMDDGTKRHMGIDHKLFGSPAGTPVSNADLDQCPDYVPPVTTIPPVVIPPIVAPPLTGHISADLGAGGHITGSIG